MQVRRRSRSLAIDDRSSASLSTCAGGSLPGSDEIVFSLFYFCSRVQGPCKTRGSIPLESFPAGVATGCDPSGGSVWGLCMCGVGPSFTGADPESTSRWRSPLLPCRRAGQLGRWCKAYRLRLETEQGKVFAVISEATTRVNRGLDHSASLRVWDSHAQTLLF